MIDHNWFNQALEAALAWVLEEGYQLPDVQRAQQIAATRQGTYGEKSLAALVLARHHWRETDGKKDRQRAFWELANACQGLGKTVLEAGRREQATRWLSLAFQLYSGLGDWFTPSAATCASLLKELGIQDPASYDPFLAPSLPRQEAPSAEGKGQPIARGVTIEETAFREGPATGVASGFEPSTERPNGPRVETRQDDEIVFGVGEDEQLTALVKTWAGSQKASSLVDEYRTHFEGTVYRNRALIQHLRTKVDGDFEFLRDLLDRADTGFDPDDPRENLRRARVARQLPYRDQIVDETSEQLARRRWLVAGFWNFVLLQKWPTNLPECAIDALGYLRAVSEGIRYKDELLQISLALTEVMLSIVQDEPALVDNPRISFVREWLQASIGTYLLLAGPHRVAPSRTFWDQKTPREAGDVAPRARWAGVLLGRWQNPPESEQVAFLLAALAGWRREVISLIFGKIFTPDLDIPEDAAARWRRATTALMDLAQQIYIASNPWVGTRTEASAADLVESSGEPVAAPVIPNAALQVMVCQFFAEVYPVGWEGGAPPAQNIHVLGKTFAGRRVPTYMLVRPGGPFAVVKLDYTTRAEREANNFEPFAKGIHPIHRPSDCRLGRLTLWATPRSEPLQAVLTSYAFGREEMPETLSEWIRRADGDSVQKLLEALFTDVLYGWVGHTSRQPIDLRMEYPILRPHPPARLLNRPRSEASSELARLAGEEVEASLGVKLTPDQEAFDSFAGTMAKHVFGWNQIPDAASNLLNPVWLAAEIAGLGRGALESALFSSRNPLSAYDTLLCISHGDLHAENVLCASPQGTDRLPRLIMIDFESAHWGHVCKDIARLEASIICQVFEWESDDVVRLLEWFGESCRAQKVYDPPAPSANRNLEKVIKAAWRLRRLAHGCGHIHWPLTEEEYLLALLGSLLPLARYTFPETMTPANRATAVFLSAIVAHELSCRWKVSTAA